MSEPTVLAALISGVLLLIGAALKVVADRASSRTTAQADWQTRLEGRVTRQDADLLEMRETVAEQSRRIGRLEDDLRDSEELVRALLPWAIWDLGGRQPPDPVINWRVHEHLRRHPPTGPIPTQEAPPSEGPSS